MLIPFECNECGWEGLRGDENPWTCDDCGTEYVAVEVQAPVEELDKAIDELKAMGTEEIVEMVRNGCS